MPIDILISIRKCMRKSENILTGSGTPVGCSGRVNTAVVGVTSVLETWSLAGGARDLRKTHKACGDVTIHGVGVTSGEITFECWKWFNLL